LLAILQICDQLPHSKADFSYLLQVSIRYTRNEILRAASDFAVRNTDSAPESAISMLKKRFCYQLFKGSSGNDKFSVGNGKFSPGNGRFAVGNGKFSSNLKGLHLEMTSFHPI
jgi:hypothetical protein